MKINLKLKKPLGKRMLRFAAWTQCLGWGYDPMENRWSRLLENDIEENITPKQLYRIYKKDPTF